MLILGIKSKVFDQGKLKGVSPK